MRSGQKLESQHLCVVVPSKPSFVHCLHVRSEANLLASVVLSCLLHLLSEAQLLAAVVACK